MKTYTKDFEFLMKKQRDAIKALERHKDFYQIYDKLQELKHSYCFHNQYSQVLSITLCVKRTADKTYPHFIKELVEAYPFVEEKIKPIQNKKEGKYTFHFQHKTEMFGNGDRPSLTVTVDYTELCVRVITGTESYEVAEYHCE